ncbi:MAG: LacI family DNA-binding transcriptional regulator [Anaerolineae bacterium]|nr:LacI family DNA-binding transcriptional regulator [Anaerolineae bacterium]
MRKQPTQEDVARLAGVSRATVSYIVNGLTDGRVAITEETQQRVLDAIEKLGYEPHAMARSLRLGTTHTIGLLLPDMRNPHYWQIACGAEQQAQDAGYDLLLVNTSLDPDKEIHAVNALSRRRIDGLVLLLTFPERHTQEIERLADKRVPVVALGGRIPGVDCVDNGYRDGAVHVMEYLIQLGHRRIGLIHGVASEMLGQERRLIYRRVVQTAGLPVGADYIEPCGTTPEAGYLAAQRLLSRSPRPTALMVINDLLAIAAVRAAAEMGLRVPEDLSIASFDDIELASYVTPPLTTVRVNAEEMGRAAVRLVFARLQDPALPPQQIYIPSELIVRASTGPAPVQT